MMRKIYPLLLLAITLPMCKVYAQATNDSIKIQYKPVLPVYREVLGDTTVIGKNNRPQQKDFEQGVYPFPPKPKSKWEAALTAGGLFISGDVPSKGGYGFGFNIRKSFGYVVSIKGEFM